MCPAIKLKSVYRLSTSSRAALIPPPDGGEVLPTSASDYRHLQRHSWPSAPHGRPRRVVIPRCFVSRPSRPCLRRQVFRDDQSPATNESRRLYGATTGPSEVGQVPTEDWSSRCKGQAPPVEISHVVVWRPLVGRPRDVVGGDSPVSLDEE